MLIRTTKIPTLIQNCKWFWLSYFIEWEFYLYIHHHSMLNNKVIYIDIERVIMRSNTCKLECWCHWSGCQSGSIYWRWVTKAKHAGTGSYRGRDYSIMSDAIPQRKYSQRPNLCMNGTVILIDSNRNLLLIFKIDRF